ncbi:23S rRNA (guanosine(2251)-2'-O)-methyltransferase RlmB [Candidatus Berkiella cookevillensis]|uniref:23S rRNA (Guanosine(2251)-2'-O)-methyltransferase RlmB n=1 Tax=Candidatus Berkiella cookevillensis TaxID=437022 RepID=A0A0Q9YG86_9GAMM|nr:23S rRNA (guanosine(2251)-2'-O)-methyltransferase RlmB [Candidatus Berkiella cookevillensis]MCS5707560.1 23S rRNA (guanosine(2251)-2'-O)-methyltransferase RlmB [Candidatus Berkiella cookevillensis]
MTDYIYGIHAAKALIEHQPQNIKTIYFSKTSSQRISELVALAQTMGIAAQIVNPPKLESLAQAREHQGIVLAVKPFALRTEQDLKLDLAKQSEKAFFLILDAIQDPHNLGACIRTAEALGVHGLIFPQAKSASITASVRKVACGAEMGLPLYQVTNLARCIELLKSEGIWVLGAVVDASQTLYTCDLKRSIAIVMGNEQNGIRPLTQKSCDEAFSIPLSGMTQSLNVSVATGICLSEVVRQRL